MTKIIFISLFLMSSITFGQNVSLIQPKNNFISQDTLVFLEWNTNSNALVWYLQIAFDENFSNLFYENNTLINSYITLNFNYNFYYWRIRYFDGVNYSNWSNTGSFYVFDYSKINSLVMNLNTDSLELVNDSIVSIWYDQSGFEKNAYQNISETQPILRDSIILNKSALFFDGSNDKLKIDSSANIGSLFMLFNWEGADLFPTYNGLISPQTADQNIILDAYPSTSNFETRWSAYFDENIHINGVTSLDCSPMSQFKIISGVNSDLQLYPNLFLAADRYYTNRMWNGYIAEILIYEEALSDSIRFLVEQSLRYKYAPPVNLGYDIKIPHGFCDTTINAGKRFTDYIWSTGNIEDTLSTLSVNQSGRYSVTVTDIFGFESVDSIMVYYPEVNQLTDSTICYGDSIKWNTGLNHYYNFDWKDATTDSLISIFAEGEYYVQITDTFGCVFNSDTAHITIDHYPETTSLGADEELCSGQSLFLETGAAETIDYLWSTNETDDHIVIETAGDYSVTTTNNIGCIAKDTINIQIQGYAPTPGFLTKYQCFGDLTQFTDTSSVADNSNITAWDWDFGDASNSNMQHPTHTYADTGNYQITLHLTTDSGCENTLLKNTRIYSNPIARFYTNQLCQNYRINFVNNSSSAMGEINYSRWDFGNNDTTIETSTQYIFDTEGIKNIQLKVITTDACEDILDTNILIKPSPKADFSHSAICVNQNTLFTDQTEISGVLSIINWDWQTSNGFSSIETNPSFTFSNSEQVQISLKVQSINGCSDTISKHLFIYNKPTALFNAENICFQSPILIDNFSSDNQSSIQNYYWWLNDELISQLEEPDYVIKDTGFQKITLKVISQSACQDTITQFFRSYPLPNSNFSISDIYTTPLSSILFTANDYQTTNQYHYKFGDGQEQFNAEATHSYADSGYYEPKLIVLNTNLCSDSTSKSIQIVQPLLDLAISNLKTLDNDGKTKISFLISNIGNLNIDTINFRIEMNDESVFEEQYANTINLGESRELTLNAQFLFSASEAHYLCVTAFVKSSYTDINLSNNIECLSHNIDDKILKIYPNPVKNLLRLMYRSNNDEEIIYEINDALGRIISTGTIIVKKDVHKYKINIEQIASGLYSLKINGAIVKFIKE